MPNVKLGGNTISGVNKVKLENADSAGNYLEFPYPSGNQDISDASEVSVIGKATARISAAEREKLIAGNIRSGVTLLGVPGSLSGGYTVTLNVTNGTGSGATAIPQGQGANVVAKLLITPTSHYYLPNAITVTNASYTYDDTTGEVLIHTPTGNVTVSATCVAEAPLAMGDVILVPYSQYADINNQSTWTKMLVLSKSGTTLELIPLDYDWDEVQQTNIPRPALWSGYMNEWIYYYDSGHGYPTTSAIYDSIDHYHNPNSQFCEWHSTFKAAAVGAYSSLPLYQYSHGEYSSTPDLSSQSSQYTVNPPACYARPFCVRDLATLFGGSLPSDSDMGAFMFPAPYSGSEIKVWTADNDANGSNYYQFIYMHSPYYGYEGYYDPDSSNSYYALVVAANIENLTYVRTQEHLPNIVTP